MSNAWTLQHRENNRLAETGRSVITAYKAEAVCEEQDCGRGGEKEMPQRLPMAHILALEGGKRKARQ